MHVPHRVIRPHVSCVASSALPTKHGQFTAYVFLESPPEDERGRRADFEKEHVALVFGDVAGQANVPVRVHSECMTGEVFGSLKCDCKAQLDAAMAEVALRGAGAILYLRQEGRGIGLTNKIRAYDLQSEGHDTVDANRLLGLPDDAREYDVAADMLGLLDIQSILLMTNNPDKMTALRGLGVQVNGRLPLVVAPNAFSAGYLEAKRLRMAHELPSRPVLRIASGDAE